MRLALILLAGASLAGCTHDGSDGPLDTPPALTHNPLAADSAGALSPDSLAGTFEGHYSAGFEHAGFVPCGASGEAWWTQPMAGGDSDSALAAMYAAHDVLSDLSDRYTLAVGDSAGTFGHGVTVFARLRGRLSPRRDTAGGMGYGHLGAYTRAITIDSVEALVRDTVVAGCPAPASVRP